MKDGTLIYSHTNAIVAEDLRKTYNSITALGGVSFSVNPGEIFGILGPNGAGKTTAVEILEALRLPDSGQAYINGIDVLKKPREIKKIIGVQLQASAFFDKLTLKETVEVYMKAYKEEQDPIEILNLVALKEKSGSYYKTLSGGQKQKFSIAIGLVNNPVIIFLDEPTTGLDPVARRNLWTLIQDIRERGKTILLTTHYMEEAEELCDRIAIMNNGKITALDTPDNLINQLLAKGFKGERKVRAATLEDVFLDLTGQSLLRQDKA